MYCSQCGKEIPDNSKFCNECGSAVVEQSEQQVVEKEVDKNASLKKNKETRKKIKLWHIIVTVVAVTTIVISCIVFPRVFSRYSWNEVKLSSVLPEPESRWGDISSNTKDYLYLYVHSTSLDEYDSYVAACVDRGFNIEPETENSSYTAFNTDGYKLTLYYYQSDKKMNIKVDAPMEMKIIQWPTSNIASLLPTPTSTLGKIELNDEKEFSIYLGNTSYSEYNTYINECESKGFTVDFQKQDKCFFAKNADGYQINVQYKGCNVVYISIIEPQRTLNICFTSVNSDFEFDVYVDDSWELGVEVGKAKTCTVELGMGEHIIKVRSDDDYDIYDTYVIDVTNDEEINFDVNCTENEIKIGLAGELKISNDTNDTTVTNNEEISNNDSEETEKNINTVPQVNYGSFNIKDKELIDWINSYSEFEVSYTEIDIDSDVNTGYGITSDDGESGVLILNHGTPQNVNGGNIKNQEVCGILFVFDDMSLSIASAIWTANNIDPSFSINDAVSEIIDGNIYSEARMSIIYLEDSEVTILAPTIYISEILGY